jgi:hypothetical protein
MSESCSSETAHHEITTSEHIYQDRLQEILNAANSIGRKKPGDSRVS